MGSAISDEEKARVKALEAALSEARSRLRKNSGPKYPGKTHSILEEMKRTVETYSIMHQRPSQSHILSRADVLKLCMCLKCKWVDTNTILLAARYEPIPIELKDQDLERALKLARATMQYLQMPAYVLKHNWDIEYWNQYILKFLDWTPTYARKLKGEGRLNVIDLIFDPDLKIRSLFAEDWEGAAWRNVYGYKSTTLAWREDQWYEDQLERWHKLDDFTRIWNEVKEKEPPAQLDIGYTTHMKLGDKDVRFHSLIICHGNLYYPQVAAFRPADKPSKEAFAACGIPVPYDDVS